MIDKDELARRWPGFNIQWVEPGQTIAKRHTNALWHELRPLFLWLAVALFFLRCIWHVRAARHRR